jgi:hypothetical protein
VNHTGFTEPEMSDISGSTRKLDFVSGGQGFDVILPLEPF